MARQARRWLRSQRMAGRSNPSEGLRAGQRPTARDENARQRHNGVAPYHRKGKSARLADENRRHAKGAHGGRYITVAGSETRRQEANEGNSEIELKR